MAEGLVTTVSYRPTANLGDIVGNCGPILAGDRSKCVCASCMHVQRLAGLELDVHSPDGQQAGGKTKTSLIVAPVATRLSE